MDNYQIALDDITEAIKMEPNNKDLREQLAAIKEAKKTQGIPEKSVIEGFFKKGVYTEKKYEPK